MKMRLWGLMNGDMGPALLICEGGTEKEYLGKPTDQGTIWNILGF